MPRKTSLVRRVAWGSALAASAAALVAAFATSLLAHYFIERAEDRRLQEAATTFAIELDEGPSDEATITKIHHDETHEMVHTGMLFAVYDQDRQRLVGDERLALPHDLGCVTIDDSTVRTCWTRTSRGLAAVVGAARPSLLPVLAGAALLAALMAALLAWIASRPMSRHIVAPLSRLRTRLDQIDLTAISEAELGPAENVLEVDALRDAIGQLVGRVERALSQAQRFAANAAHELRTPLTAILGELELLTENIPDPALRADAGRAQRQLTELAVLVERLLILSVPRGTTSALYEVISLQDLVEDTLAALSPAERERVDLMTDDAIIHGDVVLLGTMITNALVNALKFGASIRIDLTCNPQEVVIHIDDDGPGIAAPDRERVFEPFFRTAEALRRRQPGHGLGLALIRHIAELHRGTAAFVDKPDRGARLEIRLPSTRP